MAAAEEIRAIANDLRRAVANDDDDEVAVALKQVVVRLLTDVNRCAEALEAISLSSAGDNPC